MALNVRNFKGWDADDVSKWLSHIHLSSLIPSFERIGIVGEDLPSVDDLFIREKLRMTKPAEVMALKGAISNLVDSASAAQANIARRKSAAPRIEIDSKERRESFTKGQSASVGGAVRAPLPRNYTMPSEMPSSRQPQLKQNAAATDLLDDHCRYSGWIRKQGGGYKTWKRRYLILRLGCLYYFPNETATRPKGAFTLSGYKTEVCRDPKIIDKFKWTLKLTGVTSAMRVYYISFGSKRELECWRGVIDEEIQASIKKSPSIPSPTGDHWPFDGSASGLAHNNTCDGEASSDEDEDVENIYDDPEEDDNPYDDPDDPGRIYDDPDDAVDEDDPYSKIGENGLIPHYLPTQHPPAPQNPIPPTSPSHSLGVAVGGAMAGKNYKNIDGKDGAPMVPIRSAVSLQLGEAPRGERKISGGQTLPVPQPDENPYLQIIGGSGSITAGGGAGGEIPEPSRSTSSPHQDLLETQTMKIIRGGREIVIPTVENPGEFDVDYEDDNPEEDDESYTGDSDAYYIMFRKPDELMPPSCVFNKLGRSDADKLLRSKDRDGTYLIREGTHAGAEKVLSVWHIDRCRHYKLFKDDNGHYSLTQGQTFRTIPELLQYYALQSHLPRSDFYLGDAFHPEDH